MAPAKLGCKSAWPQGSDGFCLCTPQDAAARVAAVGAPLVGAHHRAATRARPYAIDMLTPPTGNLLTLRQFSARAKRRRRSRETREQIPLAEQRRDSPDAFTGRWPRLHSHAVGTARAGIFNRRHTDHDREPTSHSPWDITSNTGDTTLRRRSGHRSPAN
jgi:hypothetical protein